MINLRGIVLLLFVAIGIGMAGTLTSVMAQHTYKGYPACCCPAGFKADPDQTLDNLLGTHKVHCVSSTPRLYENGACCLPKESKYVDVNLVERNRLCFDLAYIIITLFDVSYT
jgi:hypothetical protein